MECEKLNTISPACESAIDRDAEAFARLMDHLHEKDHSSVVIMVQVENKVGLLGTDRDYCEQAVSLVYRIVSLRGTDKG